MTRDRVITLLAIAIFGLFVGFYLLQFLTFRFIATSDRRGNLVCRGNLYDICTALKQYEDRYGGPPDQLTRLVDHGLLQPSQLKCPLYHRKKFLESTFSMIDQLNVTTFMIIIMHGLLSL